MKKFYTTGEIAKIIGISEKTAKNYCTLGKIISDKTPLTNYRRISHENLLKFITDNGLSPDLLKQKSPFKVLIVDDEVTIVDVLTMGLKQISDDIIIETAMDGYDACIKAGLLIPDMILLDLRMPKADGFEVCRSIRNHEETRHAKIIVITGHVTDENVRRLKEFNPIDIFEKPFLVKTITEKIRLLMDARKKH